MGTIIVAETSYGLKLSALSHPDHLFRIISAPRKAKNNSGWVQDVRCLLCGTRYNDIDGEFLRQRAEYEDLEAQCKRMIRTIERWDRVANVLDREMAKFSKE